jgi:hypothetical protein
MTVMVLPLAFRRGIRGKNGMILRTSLVVGLLFAHTCAWAKEQPLPMPLADNLPVEVYFDQPELGVYYKASSASAKSVAGNGLVGSLVALGLQAKAERGGEAAVVPIRDRLIDYSFGKAFEPILRARIASEGLSPAPSTVWTRVSPSTYEEVGLLPARALTLHPYYAVSEDFRQLTVILDAMVVDRMLLPKQKMKFEQPFHHRYQFIYTLTEASPAEASTWAALPADMLASLLERAGQQVMDMMAYDFGGDGRAQWGVKIPKTEVTLGELSFKGREERRGDQWVWIRTKEDGLEVLSGHQPLTPELLASGAAASPATAGGTP